MAIKRYYRFGKEAGKCWRECQTLRELQNPKWLKTQAQNQLLWNTHPLFFDICLNPPAVYALEKALEKVTEDTRNVIVKYIKKVIGRDKDEKSYRRAWFGFLSEIFVLLQLSEKGLEFDYRSGMPGADFIIPALNNLKIEVTSLQSLNRDGMLEAYYRWQYSLESFITGLDLKLLRTSSASRLSEQNWLDGFSYFEAYVKKGLNVGDEFTLCNRDQRRLAKFKVQDIDSGFDGTLIDLPSSTYSAQTKTIAEKLRRKFTSVVDNKRNQIGVGPGLILLDLTLKDLLQKLAFSTRQKVKVRESLTDFLSQRLYSDIIAFVTFERDLDGEELSDIFIISNPDSKLAKTDPVLFRKTIDIFG